MVTPGLLIETVFVKKLYRFTFRTFEKYDFSICFHAVDICNDNKDKSFP